MLTIGDKAPDFSLPRDGGETITMSDFSSQNIVLYFYPKDDTSGCTKEAIAFSDLLPSFADSNTVVIGVSKDTVAKHDKFIAKHNLGVILVSDVSGALCESFGTWVEKSMYGRKYMGIERTTVLIEATSQRIVQIWNKVKVSGHAGVVLGAAQKITARPPVTI